MILRVQQILEPGIDLEPHVVVAVVFVSHVDRNTLCVLARVQDLQAIRVVNARLRRPGPAPVRLRRWGWR
jgi:hypothetical protein